MRKYPVEDYLVPETMTIREALERIERTERRTVYVVDERRRLESAMSRIESQFQVEEGGTTDDRRFSLEAVRCLGACGLAPVMVVGQDTYGDVSSDKVIDLLEKYE